MKIRSLLVAAASIVVVSLTVYAADEIKLDGIKCAMNPKRDAKAEKFVEYKGGKVFFCCDNCPKSFSKKVKKDKVVAAKGNQQLIATKQAKNQTKCPFSGKATNPDKVVTVGTAKIAVCCGNCVAKAKKLKGDDQLLALFGDDAFKKAGFTVGKKKS